MSDLGAILETSGAAAVVPDADNQATTQDLGVWPAMPQALTVAGDGTLRPVVQLDGTSWAPTTTGG